MLATPTNLLQQLLFLSLILEQSILNDKGVLESPVKVFIFSERGKKRQQFFCSLGISEVLLSCDPCVCARAARTNLDANEPFYFISNQAPEQLLWISSPS